jgi:hypothetical protein
MSGHRNCAVEKSRTQRQYRHEPTPLPSSALPKMAPNVKPAIMDLQAATRSDIPAIMLVERTEGYARLVGHWDAERHACEMEKPSSRYLLARQGPEHAGFAILEGVGSANQCIRLRRIAVQNAGRGVGSLLAVGPERLLR